MSSVTNLVDLAAEKCSNPEEVNDSIATNPRDPRCTHRCLQQNHRVSAVWRLLVRLTPLIEVYTGDTTLVNSPVQQVMQWDTGVHKRQGINNVPSTDME